MFFPWKSLRPGVPTSSRERGSVSPLFRLHRGLLLAALSLGLIVLSGSGDQEARFNDLGHRLMCPCGCGEILLECNHVGCAYSDHMRQELAAAIERGDNDNLALQSFVQKYGTAVLAAPTTTGFNRTAWIMPYLALVCGLIAVCLVLARWRRRGRLAEPAGGAPRQPSRPSSGTELVRFREQAREETEV